MKYLIPILLFSLLGCSTMFDNVESAKLTAEGEKVIVKETAPSNCKFIQEISESDWLVGLRKYSIIKARNTAAKLNANSIYVKKIEFGGRAKIWADAYTCP